LLDQLDATIMICW